MSDHLEVWREIPGYECRYLISDHGRIRSFAQSRRGRILRPVWTGRYWQVTLYDGEKNRQHCRIHQLVLLAFEGPPPVLGMWGLHRDDNQKNNHLSNLYWGTSSQNAFDRVRNGSDVNAKKVECKRGHLLAGANLISDGPRRRGCRACARTTSLSKCHGRQGDEVWIQQVADKKYLELSGV